MHGIPAATHVDMTYTIACGRLYMAIRVRVLAQRVCVCVCVLSRWSTWQDSQNASVYGLEPVSDIRERTTHNHTHSILRTYTHTHTQAHT